MCIKSDANNGQQYQKWLFAVSEINKIGIGFISVFLIFLLKALVSYLTISKRKNLSLPLKDETDQLTCLVLPECLSVKICCISPSNSEANRDGADAESPFPLFFSFPVSFRNSSPREKVGNCLRFGTGGWSLFLSIIVAKYLNILPTLTMAARAKTISGKAICSRHQRESALSRFGASVCYWIWLRGSASYVVINNYNIDRTLRALWLVKNLCFIRV